MNLVLPVGANGTIQPGTAFNTIFQTGTTLSGSGVAVTAGTATTGVNFSVAPRKSTSIYDIESYTYFWDVAAQDWDISKPAWFQLGDTSPARSAPRGLAE